MFGRRSRKLYLKLFTVLAVLILYVSANIFAEPVQHKSSSVMFLKDKEFLPVVLKDIDNAKKSISLAMYMFKTSDDRRNDSTLIEKAMVKAAQRGVEVYVIMDLGRDKELTTIFNTDTGDELKKAGVKVVYDSKTKRLHSKALVIDHFISYVGSHNYTHSAMRYNGEATLRVESADLAAEIEEYIRTYK